MIHHLLDAQPNPLAPVTTLLGFVIAMVFLYVRSSNRKKKEEGKQDDEVNKML
jgi:preprotein translocase subunit YajC